VIVKSYDTEQGFEEKFKKNEMKKEEKLYTSLVIDWNGLVHSFLSIKLCVKKLISIRKVKNTKSKFQGAAAIS